MPQITSADVSYTNVDSVVSAPGRVRRRVKVTFPTTTNTGYPTGGVPLLGPNLAGTTRGLVNSVKVIAITPSATASMNPLWQWNGSTTAPTLVGLQESVAGTASTSFDQIVSTQVVTQNSQVLTLEVEPG
jgi:hypothetical protein